MIAAVTMVRQEKQHVPTVAPVALFYRFAHCAHIVCSMSCVVLVPGQFTHRFVSVTECPHWGICRLHSLGRSFSARLVGVVQLYVHLFGCSRVLAAETPPGLRMAVDRLHAHESPAVGLFFIMYLSIPLF
jgi:hypothetical protein